jgi:hypothetical protein
VKATTILWKVYRFFEDTYGVCLLVVSERIMSIPPFLTAARTAFDDPISTPTLKLEIFVYYLWRLWIPYSM